MKKIGNKVFELLWVTLTFPACALVAWMDWVGPGNEQSFWSLYRAVASMTPEENE